MIDADGLKDLERDLGSPDMLTETRKVLNRGALNVKTDAQRRRAGSRHFPHLARAITYEMRDTPAGGVAEIGPEHGRPQANLGHIPEYGARSTAPQPYMAPAGDAEAPRLALALLALAEREVSGR